MRRLLAVVLLALPLAGAPPAETCQPVVTVDGTRGTADFRKCSGIKLEVKAPVTLTIVSIANTYNGYVLNWDGEQAAFALTTEVRPSRGEIGTLEVAGYGSWRVRLLYTAPAPRNVDPRTINPANVNPANVNPENAAGPKAAPSLPAVDHDIVTFFADAGGRPHAITSAGNEIVPASDALWQVRANSLPAGALPLRHGAVTAAGRLLFDSNADVQVNAIDLSARWAVGDGGRAYRSGDGKWTPVTTGVTENLYGVFAIGERVWIAGQNGLLLTTTGGGSTWSRPDINAPTLRAIAFTGDGNTGYAAGDNGTILRSDDRGATWTHLTNTGSAAAFPFPLPAPWYILLNLLVTIPALVLAAKGRPNEDSIEQTESIADQLVSDRALEAGDPDALNLRAIALGISRFLRNEKTVPPLTVAVTGEWGSGKSSLMNLLAADLREWAFRPVWFNAWHHQKEQHFLASLVQAIRRDASPPWWHLPFRLRLLWRRCRQHPLLVSALLLVIAVLIGYERQHKDDHHILEPLVTAIRSGTFWDFLVTLPDKLKDEFAFLVSIIGAVTALWKGVQSFAAKPAALLARAASAPKLGDLDAEISFRGRFAPEFRDVTEALGERPLVLFVDDLDRCQPDSVREMLEAINFLVTSGNCFVILGIDRARVERYLNLSFGKAAEEEKNFATNYLDKLINIEVPVPAPNDREALSILNPEEEPEERETAWADRLRAGMAAAWALKPVALAAVLIWMGVSLGSSMQRRQPDQPAGGNAPAITTTAVEADLLGGSTAAEERRFKTGEPGNVVPGQPRIAVLTEWPLLLFLLGIGGVGGWLFTRKPGLVVKDSKEFEDALAAWQPLLVARNRTPRSLKRFINRVRYLAMRQRPQEEEPTMWRALRAALTGRKLPPPLVPDAEPIPDPVLVALAAMTYGSRDGKDFQEAIAVSEARHIKRFGDLPVSAWKSQFERISADVRVS